MIRKELILLLVSILIFNFYGKPAFDSVNNLLENIKFLNEKISRERDIARKKEKIKEILKREKAKAESNDKKLFSYKEQDSMVFDKIQSFIKSAVDSSGGELSLSNWGEKVKKDGYSKFPLSFVVKMSPYSFDTFLKKVYTWNKLLKIETASIGKDRDRLVVRFIVSGFKREKAD